MYHGVLSRPAPIPTVARPRVGRRGFLVAGFAFALGAASGGTIGARYARGVAPSAANPGDDQPALPAELGSLAWARSLTVATDDELVHAAGDLERVTARHRDAVDLAPLFVRILDTAGRFDGPEADMAGACAVRSLVRLGQAARAVDASASLADRRGFDGTRAARESAQRRLRGDGR